MKCPKCKGENFESRSTGKREEDYCYYCYTCEDTIAKDSMIQ